MTHSSKERERERGEEGRVIYIYREREKERKGENVLPDLRKKKKCPVECKTTQRLTLNSAREKTTGLLKTI